MSEKTKNHQTYFQLVRPSKIKYRQGTKSYGKPLAKHTLRKIYTFYTPPNPNDHLNTA